MLQIKFQRYRKLSNGLIADLKNDEVLLEFNKGSRIFVIMDIPYYSEEENLQIIPCNVIAVEHEELLGSVLGQEIVVEEIIYEL